MMLNPLVGLLFLLCLMLYLASGRGQIAGKFRLEASAWMLVAVLSIFLMLDISKPFWHLLWEYMPKVIFPWRMQVAENLAILFLFLACAETVTGTKRRIVWRGNFLVLMLCLAVVSQINLFRPYDVHSEGFLKLTGKAMIVPHPEYRTRWNKTRECTLVAIYELLDSYPTLRDCISMPPFSLVSGEAEVTVTDWGNERIALNISAREPSVLRLRQFYFPSWSLKTDNEGSRIYTQGEYGFIHLAIPVGKNQQLVINQDAAQVSPWVFRARMLSMVTALGLLFMLVTGRRFLPRNQ